MVDITMIDFSHRLVCIQFHLSKESIQIIMDDGSRVNPNLLSFRIRITCPMGMVDHRMVIMIVFL